MLEQIIKTKHEEMKHFVMPDPSDRGERYSLKRAMLNPNHRLGLIAEIKKASPSKGLFKIDMNPKEIATRYIDGGADALSVLTDHSYFKGHNDNIRMIRDQVKLPILRKDFIIDRKQIEESDRIGADVILLIASVLDASQLQEYYMEAYERKMEVIVEIHHEQELQKLKHVSPEIIGINNRDLKTFKTDVQQTLDMLPNLPEKTIVISESGIRNAYDIDRLYDHHVNGVLVGESLMLAEDPSKAIHDLFGEQSK